MPFSSNGTRSLWPTAKMTQSPSSITRSTVTVPPLTQTRATAAPRAIPRRALTTYAALAVQVPFSLANNRYAKRSGMRNFQRCPIRRTHGGRNWPQRDEDVQWSTYSGGPLVPHCPKIIVLQLALLNADLAQSYQGNSYHGLVRRKFNDHAGGGVMTMMNFNEKFLGPGRRFGPTNPTGTLGVLR